MEHKNGAPAIRNWDEVPTLEEIRDWSICYVDAGQGFVGVIQRHPDGSVVGSEDGAVLMDPCYLYMGNYQIGPQGAQRLRAVLPVEMLADQTAYPVRPCMVLHLRQLSPGDFADIGKSIHQGVEQCQSIRRQVRAARSGISLVPAGAKLPPINQRRG